MKKSGLVCSVDGQHATVIFVRSGACGGECSSCKGCESQEMTVEILNTVNAKPGDRVWVYTDEAQMAKVSNLMYFIPFAMFLIGMAIGYFIAQAMGSGVPEIFSAILGFVFLLLSRGFLKALDKKIGLTVKHNLSMEIIDNKED